MKGRAAAKGPTADRQAGAKFRNTAPGSSCARRSKCPGRSRRPNAASLSRRARPCRRGRDGLGSARAGARAIPRAPPRTIARCSAATSANGAAGHAASATDCECSNTPPNAAANSARPMRLTEASVKGLGSGSGIATPANLHGSRASGFWDRNIGHTTGGHAAIAPSTAVGARSRPRQGGLAMIDATRAVLRRGRPG